MRRALKWIILLVLVGAAAIGAGWFWRRSHLATVEYETAEVVRDDLIQTVTASGQLNPVTNVQVGSQISGTIAQLFADYNSKVAAGQILVQIDPATFLATVHQAEGDLASATAGLELAQVNARRSQELLAAKLIPQSDFDQAQATLHQAEASVKIKSASLERARVDYNRCTIYSPVDGIVISRSVDVGQTVAASLSAPTLFVIANDLTKMQIDANVAEADVGNVAADQDVEFTVDAFPDQPFRGKVVQVRNAPLTVQNVVTYDTIISVNNPDLKLKPGMTANVSIIVARHEDILKVPNAALRFHLPDLSAPPTRKAARQKHERKPTRNVYILDADGNPQPVAIKTGISDGIATEVLDGLKEGDKVIIGSNGLTESSRGSASPLSGMPRRMFR